MDDKFFKKKKVLFECLPYPNDKKKRKFLFLVSLKKNNGRDELWTIYENLKNNGRDESVNYLWKKYLIGNTLTKSHQN